MSDRTVISSGAPWEPVVGYSRAVRVGPWVSVAGTTAASGAGTAVGGDDPAEQAREALRRIADALERCGARLEHVVRTRMFVTDIGHWEQVGRVHGEVFGSIRPASSMVEVSRLIDPALLVEIEADAVVPECSAVARPMSFGYEGDGGLGDRLLAAVLRGDKTATSSLAVRYCSGEPLPRVGEECELVDHAGRVHGTVRITRVTIVPLAEVGDDVARDEGEGFADADAWRRAHEALWRATTGMIRADAGDPTWVLREHEPVVVEWFRVVGAPAGRSPEPSG